MKQPVEVQLPSGKASVLVNDGIPRMVILSSDKEDEAIALDRYRYAGPLLREIELHFRVWLSWETRWTFLSNRLTRET